MVSVLRRFVRQAVLVAASAMLLSACASAGKVPRPSPFPEPPTPAVFLPAPLPATVNSFSTASFISAARKLTGIPYRLGGDTPATGFDCSGYVRYVYSLFRIPVPRTVAELYHAGKSAGKTIRPGDLLFFKTAGARAGVSHVALALSDDEFIHAPAESGVVRVERLSSPYWHARFAGARRIL